MKSRASLVLMEQLVMVLVFALAAALCLGCFAKAEEISNRTVRQDEAVILAQNAAAQLKAGEIPGQFSEDGFTLEIREEDPGLPGMRQAEIRVFYEEEILFTLTTGWQEVAQ